MTLVFLKLGGSLITEKSKPRVVRGDILRAICIEISSILKDDPSINLLIGHGSGSFGHIPAKKYLTREGVHTQKEWKGFFNVWQDARSLHLIVVNELLNQGICAISFPPSATVLTQNREIVVWNLSTIQHALQNRFVPVVFGDVVFDDRQGATILSTEDLFWHLAKSLRPKCILLAGQESGIFSDYPQNTKLIEKLTRRQFSGKKYSIEGSEHPDVTGGMVNKVTSMFSLLETFPDTRILIFSGLIPGNVGSAIKGSLPGTVLSND
jgi:isopentenyl phosphate kinase